MDQTDKRALTILFTDVKGSTELRESRGDEAADRILALHENIVRTNVAHFDGHEAKFLGDGFLTDFPNPEAAVRCAVAIQRDLEQHNTADPDHQVQVRIGIHHGDVSERDGNLYGQAVHAAARVTAEAAGCQILVSATIKDLIENTTGDTFIDRGLFWLKGFPDRWRLYEVPWRGVGEPSGPPAVAVPALTPFVERDTERANLRRAVDEALGGRGRLVFVAGEAGVGKSRLVQEVTHEAAARGMRVLSGHCVEMQGSPPYLPYVEIVEQAITSPRSALAMREALGDTAPEIARIAPALRRTFPDIAPPTDLPAELAPRYLWNSVQEFIERASRKQPLLLVLEDLHWADESTILLTEYLAPQLPEMPVVIIGTYRDIEVGIRHPLARSVNELARRRLIDRISLKTLSRGGVAAMVEGLAGQSPPEGLVQVIDSETDGNPFFVEEVFFHLAESGVLLDQEGHVRADLQIDEVDVPDSIRLVIEQRLQRLSSSTRDVLVGAAVIGRAFVPDLAGRVADVDGNVLMDSLDEGERARLLAPIKDGRLLFSHELIRQTLLADTSTMRRERLHLRAADVIEETYADEIEAHAADLAHHLSLAGYSIDRARLMRYLRMAGERAIEATAFEDAVANFTQALSLVPAEDDETRAEVLERLAIAQRSVGHWDEALKTMNEALDLYESSGEIAAFGRLSWTFVYQLSWAGRFVEGVGVAQRALAALGQAPSPNLARLLSSAGWAISLGGDYPPAAGMFDQARSLVEQLGDDRALADVLHMETIHHMGFAEFDRGVETGLRAARVFEAEGALWDLCSVLAFVIFQDGTLGRDQQAAALKERTMAMARRLSHLGAMFMLLADSARRDGVMTGDLPGLHVIGQQMVEVCERGGLPWLYVGHLYLGLAAHWSGDWERAEQELRLAVELEPPAAYAGQSASLLAFHLAHQGRAHEVVDIYNGLRGALPVRGQVNSIGAWNMLCGFVEALYLVGRTEEAAALYPLMIEAMESIGDWITFDCRLASTRAALSAAAARNWDAAEVHFVAALKRAEDISDRMEQADVRRLYAMSLLERNAAGDSGLAQTFLEEATARYRAMEMPRHVQIAQDLIAKASV